MACILCFTDVREVISNRVCDNCILEWRENENKTKKEQDLTFGQKAVGLQFNPSGDDKVAKAKQLFADVIDMLYGPDQDPSTMVIHSGVSYLFKSAAFNAIIVAQMAVVKYLTWKE